ncbi:hypothetical protein [Pseudomonas sp. NFACC05-1]|uniref:hypothetical protein n=1 Tax=Pseudomonas sp. NFACC05-1 TaxID=1566241 RepID=UPI00087189A9|nr:hypothetical protein [Pseudomonas sp. NFACC05-1]SCW91842.1 hypothetical protein SAMN03159424_04378 [Pseudomonas sp. NFACC05-1]
MLTSDQHNTIVLLSDAAGRAAASGLQALADKLVAEAENLLNDGQGQSFQDFGTSRGLNMERLHGQDQYFASKHTQELFECWLTARGQKVWAPPPAK